MSSISISHKKDQDQDPTEKKSLVIKETMASLLSTSVPTMTTVFTDMVPKIIGELTLRKLTYVLHTHLIPCFQSHTTDVSDLNLIYICIPPKIYTHYTQDAYPDKLQNPGDWDGGGEITPLGRF